MDRFGIEEVYGMHNLPACRSGSSRCGRAPSWRPPTGSRSDIEGRGGHAAMPHLCVDPVVAGAADRPALQTSWRATSIRSRPAWCR